MSHLITNLILNGLYSNLMIIVNDKKYKVHKEILEINSEFFKKLFSKEYNDIESIKSSDNELCLEEFKNNEAFEIILKIIYGNQHSFEFEFELYKDVLAYSKFLIINLPKNITFYIENDFKFNIYCGDENVYINGNKISRRINDVSRPQDYLKIKNEYLNEIRLYTEKYGINIGEGFPILEISYKTEYEYVKFNGM